MTSTAAETLEAEIAKDTRTPLQKRVDTLLQTIPPTITGRELARCTALVRVYAATLSRAQFDRVAWPWKRAELIAGRRTPRGRPGNPTARP